MDIQTEVPRRRKWEDKMSRSNSMPNIYIMFKENGTKCEYVPRRYNSMPNLCTISKKKGRKSEVVLRRTNSMPNLNTEASNRDDNLDVLKRRSTSWPQISITNCTSRSKKNKQTNSQGSTMKSSIYSLDLKIEIIQKKVDKNLMIPDITNEELLELFGGSRCIEKVSDLACTTFIDKMLTAETITALEHAADVIEGTDQRDLHNLLQIPFIELIGYVPICLRILQGRITHFRATFTPTTCGASVLFGLNQYDLEEMDCPRFVRIYGSSSLSFEENNFAPLFSLILNREVYRGQRTTLCLIVFYCTLFVRMTLFCCREYYTSFN